MIEFVGMINQQILGRDWARFKADREKGVSACLTQTGPRVEIRESNESLVLRNSRIAGRPLYSM